MAAQPKPLSEFSYSGRIRRSFATRYLAVLVLFVLVLFVYACRLWSLQNGRTQTFFTYSEDDTYSYVVTLKAGRGAICDRNGKVLVSDSQNRDMVFNYNAMPSDNEGINGMILYALTALQKSGNMARRTTDLFPFDGNYPDFTPKEVLSDPQSAETKALERFLSRRGLAHDADLPTILQKMMTKYGLCDKKGNLLYSEEETMELLVVRYDMEAKNFGAYQTYTLAEEIDWYLYAYVKELPYPGVETEETATRTYAYPGYASHILGRVDRIYAEDWDYYAALGYNMTDTVGVSGCEAVFEQYLRGKDGKMRVYLDSDGNMVRMDMIEEPRNGYDVWLTIDMDLQMAAEDALAQNVADIVAAAHGEHTGEDCDAGAVVATDPNSGEVLVLASYPTYDLSRFHEDYTLLSQDSARPLFNRALDGTYAPGSTFKLGMSLAALEEGLITPASTINTKGIYTYYNSYQPRCWLYVSSGLSHGRINVTEAIRVSCNYFFYDVGRRLGIETMNDYSKKFGLGEKTGIELAESAGILAGPAYRDEYGLAEWTDIDTLSAAIGQSDNLFTPIQICQYTAAITNGGTRYRAHLLSRVVAFDTGEVIMQSEPQVLGQFSLSASSVAAVKEGMRQVIYSGTSAALKRYFSPIGVTVGGKTGTAQVRPTESDNGVFTCVAPLEAPQIAVTCLIERAGGGSAIAYTAAKVLEHFFK